MGGAALFFKRIFFIAVKQNNNLAEEDMNPLNSVRGAIITGVILALIVTLAIPPTGFAERPRRTRADPVAPASPSTSPRGHCCGFAGRRW